MGTQLIIKNGTVLDPGNGIHAPLDIAVKGEKIADVGRFVEHAAEQVIDAVGCYVVPGLIDHHVHVYPLAGNIGVCAEETLFPSGVTTVSDAGSAGSDDYRTYRDFVHASRVRIRPYLYVSPSGLASLPEALESVDPKKYDVGALQALFEEFPNDFVGLKIRTSAEIVKELGYGPLRETVHLAEKFNKPLKVHISNPPGSLEELLGYLRPGDIVSHMYMGQGSTILDESGHVKESVLQARDRGVLFETADGKRHFSYSVCEAAFRDGFYPDIISTDLTRGNAYVRPTVFSLPHLISRYCALGMALDEVISRITDRPAKQLGLYDAIGCLRVGALADIAVLRPVEMRMEFSDQPYGASGEWRHSEVAYEPVLTVKDGRIVYRSITF